MPDEEQERVITVKVFIGRGRADVEADAGRGSSLRAFLRDRHEGPVQQLVRMQPGQRGHGAVGVALHEGIFQPHGGQDRPKVVTALHFQPGQA